MPFYQSQCHADDADDEEDDEKDAAGHAFVVNMFKQVGLLTNDDLFRKTDEIVA